MQTNNENCLEKELATLIRGYGWEEFLRSLSKQMRGQGKQITFLRGDIKTCIR